MDRVRIFISSPGDVAEERQRALRVVERLQQEFSGTLSLEPLLWEQEPLLATADFQSQIRSPADFDIFATIIGSRLGSPLGSQFTRRDGSTYASGTEFEFEVAVAGYFASGRPELLFYRKSLPPDQPATPQLEKVKTFFDKWFSEAGGRATLGSYHPFATPGEFEEQFTAHLRELLHRFLPKPNNLPAPISSFLGRIELIHEVSELVKQGDVRVVNLVGPRGCGKSRLALRIARGVLPDFRDGVFLVSPAVEAIASALEIDPTSGKPVAQSVVDALKCREMLLVVDNLEQQEDSAVRDLETLVARCPGVRILAISSEALPLPGARAVTVPPLELPDPETASFAEIRDAEGVQLFVERAQAVREDFELTEENAAEILQICHRLGGLPLSIELASSRMRSMSITKLLGSLASIKVKDETGQTVYLIPR